MLAGVTRPYTTQNTNENVVKIASDHVTTLIFSISLPLSLEKPGTQWLMLMTRPLFRRTLIAVFACGFVILMRSAAAITFMPAMAAMSTMAEHMHRGETNA